MRRTMRLLMLAPRMLLVPMVLLGAGCQQIAWKPGASAADLDGDTALCEARSADQGAVHDCLRKRGWVVRVPKQPVEEMEPEAADAAAAEPLPTAAESRPSIKAPADTAAGEPRSTTASVPRHKPVPKPVDPLKPVLVQAWWKLGGQSDALTADMDSCVETLGAAHKPDLQKRLYTRALIDCMKGKGWFGK